MRCDLLAAGLNLDDAGKPGLSWLDLLAFIEWAPAGSAIHRSRFPDDHPVETLMLRSIEYDVSWLAWSKTKDGSRNVNAPKPRALTEAEVDAQTPESEKFDPMSVDAMDGFLGYSPRDPHN